MLMGHHEQVCVSLMDTLFQLFGDFLPVAPTQLTDDVEHCPTNEAVHATLLVKSDGDPRRDSRNKKLRAFDPNKNAPINI